VGGDEFIDALGVIRQAELFEQIGQCVDGGFHVGLL
jgi:hypothetical protein